MSPSTPLPSGVRLVEETPEGTSPIRWVHPEWRVRLPWLVQGTTGRSAGTTLGDFALFREGGGRPYPAPWIRLAHDLGFTGVVHSRQVHGALVTSHTASAHGLGLGPEGDGHATGEEGVLMGVTVADCVPVFLVDPVRRALALLHAGWRGTVAGILEAGVASMEDHFGSRPGDLLLHLGPAICGKCYEVGPEVHAALGLAAPDAPNPVDLRRVQALRALALGIPPQGITISSHCTRCGGGAFFSHRGGDAGRQVGFLGIRPAGDGLCGGCRWSRAIRNRKGSRFLLCRRSVEDPRYPRYPPLPVLSCPGYQPSSPESGTPGPSAVT